MKRRLVMGALGLLAGLLLGAVYLFVTLRPRPSLAPFEPPEQRMAHLRAETLPAPYAALVPLHAPKAAPRPQDWLAQQAEHGQSLNEWRAGDPVRATATQKTLYLLRLGAFSDEQLRVFELTREYLALHFGLPVQELAALPETAVPSEARRKNPMEGQLQWNTAWILEHLLPPLLPKDGVAVMAFTAVDLWPAEGWNFVFGEASVVDRVGVYSIARHGDPKAEFKKVLLRTLKVAAHEAGHMFTIQHCIAFECVMNGGNNLEETDQSPLEPCPICLAKLHEATGVDPKKRFAEVQAFLEREGLAEQVALVNKSAAALSAAK